VAIKIQFHNENVPGIICMGFCYSLLSSVVWSTISILNEEKYMAIAFSYFIIIENIGLTAFPSIIAAILSDSGYKYVRNIFFIQ